MNSTTRLALVAIIASFALPVLFAGTASAAEFSATLIRSGGDDSGTSKV